ncbi:hypothetical protein ABZ589_34550 [Streptomyces sp. NPDC013313]|uniref:hypothetical protein n=1 Tax=Streptomyces sp. NPDC013313 TaxID=3155603 RepID=UPI00340061D8
MPSQRRTQRVIETRIGDNVTPGELTDRRYTGDDAPSRSAWNRVAVPVPPASAIPTVTAVGGGSSLTAAIITGHVQPGVIWPAVTLVIAGMAYDIAVRALNRPHRT